MNRRSHTKNKTGLTLSRTSQEVNYKQTLTLQYKETGPHNDLI